MGKLVQRLLIFLLGIPLIAAFIFFLPQRGHLVLNILVVIFSALGALELRGMLDKKQLPVSAIEAAVLGGLAPALMTLVISFALPVWIIPLFLVMAAFWVLISPVFMPEERTPLYINRMAAGFIVLLYPGSLLAWICAMGAWDGILILIFLLVPIMGDSTAWAAGNLFGKNNRGIVKISPNKSIAGFIGGLFASVAVCVAAVYIFPQFFAPRFGHAALFGGVLGLISGAAAALGDLCESAIKRSAEYKDSGGLIPGRGGVLDSVDSIALAAPAFYFTWTLLFTFA